MQKNNRGLIHILLLTLTTPICSFAAIGDNTSTGLNVFFTSFTTPGKTLNQTIYTVPGDGPWLQTMPAKLLFGHYQNPGTMADRSTTGDNYNTFTRLGQIELPWQNLPSPILKLLTANPVAQNIPFNNIEFDINIFDGPQILQHLPIGPHANTFNAVFHSLLRRWRGTGIADFNVPILTGIFEANGVEQTNVGGEPIGFNHLSNVGVNYHGGDNFSPNNARFLFTPTRQIATFWLIGIYDHESFQKITVSFNIIILSNVMGELTRLNNERLAHTALAAQAESHADAAEKANQEAIALAFNTELERPNLAEMPIKGARNYTQLVAALIAQANRATQPFAAPDRAALLGAANTMNAFVNANPATIAAQAEQEKRFKEIARKAAEAKAIAAADAKKAAEEAAARAEQVRLAAENARIAATKKKADDAAAYKAEQERLSAEKKKADDEIAHRAGTARIAVANTEQQRLAAKKKAEEDQKAQAAAHAKKKALDDVIKKTSATIDKLGKDIKNIDAQVKKAKGPQKTKLQKDIAAKKAELDKQKKILTVAKKGILPAAPKPAPKPPVKKPDAKALAAAKKKALADTIKKAEAAIKKLTGDIKNIDAHVKKAKGAQKTKLQKDMATKKAELAKQKKILANAKKGILPAPPKPPVKKPAGKAPAKPAPGKVKTK